jgi:hypothetical protein
MVPASNMTDGHSFSAGTVVLGVSRQATLIALRAGIASEQIVEATQWNNTGRLVGSIAVAILRRHDGFENTLFAHVRYSFRSA